jgi:type IV pilus assembly protein PilB
MTNAELDDRLAELLTTYRVIGQSVLERARAFQRTKRGTLAGALIGLHLVQEETIVPLLEELTGVRAVNPSLLNVYPDFVERLNVLIPPAVVARILVFPAQMEVNAIHVCMINPTDGCTVRTLESLSGCRIVPFVAHESALVRALEQHYGRHVSTPIAYIPGGQNEAGAVYRELLSTPFDSFLTPAISLINRQRDAIGRDPAMLEAIIREPAVIRLVQQILARAVECGASDIHVESVGDGLRVRLRVDGAMRVVHSLPATAAVPVLARLKAMADLPIGRSDVPLDSRIGYDIVWGRGVDLRFSLVPSVTGEMVVLRVLDRTRERRALLDLGMDPPSLATVESATDLPNGLLLVTGPTGSGKSSTLYALLDRLNDENACVVTAEDPVESRVSGITQVHCDHASGVTFASALRSFMRQDPDVIMVGEIRDVETADTALKAALTGHLVLSTLHTNDAPGAVLRLINMSLEPFLIASALRVVIAQRLIRRLCPECRTLVAPDSVAGRARIRALPPDIRSAVGCSSFFEPLGCPACNGSGYRGRTGIFEILAVSSRIEELIVRRSSAQEIRAQAKAEGMRTLRDAALEKVVIGETSIAEVLEHTVADAHEGGVATMREATAHA